MLLLVALRIGLLIHGHQRAIENEKSTGLGAVEVEFDIVSMWNQSSPLDLFEPAAPAVARTRAIEAQGYVGFFPAGADFNTEEYGVISESRFLQVSANPLSTFSIDVDTASYSNVRRFLTDGTLPPKDAVRIEELINYFRYRYPDPPGDQPFSITTGMARCPWQPQHHLVRVGLRSKPIPISEAPASNLVFLVDVSGSMDMPDKLPLLKKAFALLVDQLRPRDRVAIVVYAGAAGLVLPSTPGYEKTAIHAALDQLGAGGSTAGGAGIHLAYKIARENFIENANNRVILATDGDFNTGVSSDNEMIGLIERERESGVFLSVLGFGEGNLKDSKMEKIADHGNGNYAYIDTLLEARKVLVDEVGATLVTVAKDVKLQVEFNPATVEAYRLIGYENRLLADEDFNDDKKDAGELGAGHTVTALYEVVPVGAGDGLTDVDKLKYQENVETSEARGSGEVLTVKVRYKHPEAAESQLLSRPVPFEDAEMASASEDFRFAAAVAEFGMLLRDSPHKAEANYEQVLELADGSAAAQSDDPRFEFLYLVRTARRLSGERTVSQLVSP